MKQTNNTMTFLMAQYRAIIQQARLKDLPSSVLLGVGFSGLTAFTTPVLAAGSDTDKPPNTTTSTPDSEESDTIYWGTAENPSQLITINGQETVSNNIFAQNLTIIGSGASLNLAKPATVGYGAYISNNITISDGASLNASGTDTQLVQVIATDNNQGPYNTKLTINNGSINLNRASLNVDVAYIDNANITLEGLTGLGSIKQNDYHKFYTNIYFGLGECNESQSIAGAATISNSNINILNQALLGAIGNLTINKTNIVLSGEKDQNGVNYTLGEVAAKALIKTSAETTLDEESTITVKSGSTGGLFNNNFTVQGDSSITVEKDASLDIAGRIGYNATDSGASFSDNAKFNLKSGSINNEGVLTIGSNNTTLTTLSPASYHANHAITQNIETNTDNSNTKDSNSSQAISTYSPVSFDFTMDEGKLSNTGTLNIGAPAIDNGQASTTANAFDLGKGTSLKVAGGQIVNEGILNINAGSSLSFTGNNSFINDGSIKLIATAKDANSNSLNAKLEIAAKALDSFESGTSTVSADLKSLGKVSGYGTVALTNSSSNTTPNESKFYTDTTAFKNQFGIDLTVTTDTTDTNNSSEQHVVFGLDATQGDIKLQFTDDLNLNTQLIGKYFTNLSTSQNNTPNPDTNESNTSGEASIGTALKLTFSTQDIGENFNGISLHAKDLVFKDGTASTNEKILVSGSGEQITFVVANSLDSISGKPLELQNTQLKLGDYIDIDSSVVGQSNVDLILKDNSTLKLQDNPWTMKNITLSGPNTLLDISNSSTDNKYQNGLEVSKLVLNNQSSKAKVTGNTYLKVDSVDIKSGSLDLNSGASLVVLGDNDSKTLDFAGGSNVKITSSSLELNDVSDTIGMTFTQGSGDSAGFSLNQEFSQIVANNADIYLNLDNVQDAEQMTLAQANSLLGLITNSGTGLIHITGKTAPVLETTTNAQGEEEFSFNQLASGGSLDLTFDTEQTRNTILTDIGVDDKISGGWKAVQTETGNATVIKNGTLSLQGNKSGYFAQDKNGNVIGINLEDNSILKLNNSAKIGAITGKTATLQLTSGSRANVVDKNNNTADIVVKSLQAAGSLHAKNVTSNQVDLTQGAILNIESLKVQSGTGANDGVLNSSGANMLAQNADLGVTANINGGHFKITENLTSQNLNLDAEAKLDVLGTLVSTSLKVIGNSELNANAIELTQGGIMIVGEDDNASTSTMSSYSSSGTNTSDSSARVTANTIKLNGGMLVIDPEFESQTATVFAKAFGSITNETEQTNIDGDIIVGKNSAFGLGGEENDFYQSLAKHQTNGSLTPKLGAYLYLNRANINLADNKLVLGTEDVTTLIDYAQSGGASIYLGSGSAIAVSAKALNAATNSSVLKGNNALSIESSKGGTLIVPSKIDGKQLATIFGSDATLNNGSKINVTTENGLYSGVIDESADLQNTGDFTMTVAENTNQILSDLSKPTYDYVIKNVVNSTNHNSSFGYQFLNAAASSVNNGIIEKSARIASLGGAAQIANVVSNATTETIQDQARNLNSYGSINAQTTTASPHFTPRTNLWVTPIYRNFNADAAADNIEYGTDLNLFGTALGADYTLNNGLKIGAMFNIGNGDAASSDKVSGISNEFDYYSLGIYTGFSPIKNLTLTADISYTNIDNSLEANTGVLDYGKVQASTNSKAWSMGVDALYKVKVNNVNVEPHIGLRYTNFSIDDYSVKLDGQTLAHISNDSANRISIPLGVALSTEIEHEGWTISPEADFTLTLNMADDEIQSHTMFEGINDTLNLNTEFGESFTYGALFGVSAQKDNLSLGVDIGYTGSSQSDEFSIGAKASYKF